MSGNLRPDDTVRQRHNFGDTGIIADRRWSPCPLLSSRSIGGIGEVALCGTKYLTLAVRVGAWRSTHDTSPEPSRLHLDSSSFRGCHECRAHRGKTEGGDQLFRLWRRERSVEPRQSSDATSEQGSLTQNAGEIAKPGPMSSIWQWAGKAWSVIAKVRGWWAPIKARFWRG